MLHLVLESRLREAVGNVIPDADLPAIRVRPCPDPRFGDYQTNALIGLAKARRLNPRQLAAEVIARLDVRAWCGSVEVAGAGFLNFRVSPSALATVLREVLAGGRPLVPRADPIRTVVLDFSSPNVAKPMHVGHIRSTILGDCLARTLRLLGHRVMTDNHIGDWGTQFGMLLVGWKRILDRDALAADPLRELERIYRAINARCDPEKEEFDPALLESARAELVKLQAGDSENLAIWREMQRLSQAQFDAIYARLGVRFDHTLGESFYNSRLPAVVEDLRARGIARESEGAVVVFFDGHPELKDAPTIVQKRDGGFNYATTDLATLAYRVETWQPQEIIYVTDGRQQLHFKQVFEAFRRWKPDVAVTLAHVWFGSIRGEDNKPLKTRAGDTVKLADLLDEAEERALQVVTEKNPDLPEPERRDIARIVGIGAVKYQDLLPNRQSDYVFSWSKMLALSGNTAPYLQYAYARIRSIFRKQAEHDPENRWEPSGAVALELTTPEELRLAKHLLNFGIVVEMVADEYRPNYLCNYLFELAGHFTGFYEACPVLKAEGRQRASRLALCEITARVLQQGLNLLGIETAERM